MCARFRCPELNTLRNSVAVKQDRLSFTVVYLFSTGLAASVSVCLFLLYHSMTNVRDAKRMD